ncbi:MAG: response regulator transcription factor [Alphaproteobacteria bacterium]|nr:response regulator transcription factor [Alphaproteobacteria bacterium]MBL6937725.1 response regulator transcription factor [Alphaproteobacteria bacterium]MBL7099063.1 response regulator transcription factor [Alphaproteobacteria bacterium]
MSEKELVFVVDDDADVRESLGLLLGRAGYQVKDFESGRAFLNGAVPRERACVLADVRMPEMDGFTLQREIARRWPDLPVIIMTGHGDIPMAVRAMRAGAIDFLEKPFEKPALLDAIRRALLDGAAGIGKTVPPSDPHEVLTEREFEVFRLLTEGHQNKVVAHQLGISVRTAETHRARVMSKLGARNLADLVRLSMGSDRHS